MAKHSGTTKAGGSGNPKGLTKSKGVLRSTEFSPNAKLSDFQDGGQFVNGGSWALTTKDGYQMLIDTENGYNEDYGSNGTLITMFVSTPSGGMSDTPLVTQFVQGTPFRESGGVNVYNNQDAVERAINNTMPYLAEQANKWKKNH